MTEKTHVSHWALDLLRPHEDSGSFPCGCTCLWPCLGTALSSGPSPVGGFALDDAPLLGLAHFWAGLQASQLGRGSVSRQGFGVQWVCPCRHVPSLALQGDTTWLFLPQCLCIYRAQRAGLQSQWSFQGPSSSEDLPPLKSTRTWRGRAWNSPWGQTWPHATRQGRGIPRLTPFILIWDWQFQARTNRSPKGILPPSS